MAKKMKPEIIVNYLPLAIGI